MAIYIFAVLNIACIVALVWFNKNGDTLDQKRREVLRKHLRASHRSMQPITEQDYYKTQKRFSIVVVTHMETMLEKTYPFNKSL